MTRCRFCNRETLERFVDLGHQPLSDAFLTKEQLSEPETYYPLKLDVCTSCWLVQLDSNIKPEQMFNKDYVYYSSQSPANVSHAKEYVDMMCERFKFGKGSRILEIGSNDGYMLKWFQAKGCDVIGIDASEGPQKVAHQSGIPTVLGFFRKGWAGEFDPKADLICGINVLNHQPDINDFVAGLKIALAPEGIITFEFPHLMNMIDLCQFDTIYHEHYEYYRFSTICAIFERHGLEIFDVDEIPEHGGSLRIYAQHSKTGTKDIHGSTIDMLFKEREKGMNHINYYAGFQSGIEEIKNSLLEFLLMALPDRITAIYSTPAKGNTLLNFCGIRSDLIPFAVDKSPYKQGEFLPGSHIPVYDEEYLKKMQPDYILVLAWNLKDEIIKQLSYVKEWGGKFIIAIPEIEII
jgi:SAM-dependent methyltransferase